ncbi:MAG TPA: DoxX family protein [Holophagaceae bacterium]|jgi:putative oxidoreductase|nr:DoxX family protein [Holophagaceae bacterium]
MNMDKAITISYFLLRIVVGLLSFQAGIMIVLAWLVFGGRPEDLKSMMMIGALLALVGGLALLLGLFTRPAAFILSGKTVVDYWQFGTPHGIWDALNSGRVSAVLLCFLFLYMAARGGGAWSLDALMKRKG